MPVGQNAYAPNFSGVMGRPVSVIASAFGAERFKVGGITVDWVTVTALGADTTYAGEGRLYKAGDKVLRYGTVMCRITSVVNGSTVGKFGPYLSSATDGRQLLNPGDCFILDHSVSQLTDLDSDHPGSLFDAGVVVYMDRVASDGTAGPAANPTKALLKTAFPGLGWYLENP